MADNEKSSGVSDEVKAQNYRITERSVAIGRWIVIIFVFSYLNIIEPEGWPIHLFNLLLLFAAAYNSFIMVFMRRSDSFSINITHFSMYCDIIAVAVGLFFTGGVNSPFFFLWYLTLFTAGARFGFVKSLRLQFPIAIIHMYLVYHTAVLTDFSVLDRLIPGLFSFMAVSLFGGIFSREEHYTLELLEGFHRESIVDRLTGLHNYAFFVDELKKEQARSDRTGKPFSVVIFDLDFFKKVNDTWGHQKGNVLLKGVARIIKSNARVMDTVARYGGEEFVILMPDSNGAEMEIAERIRKKVEEAEFPIASGIVVRITISGGYSSYPRDASTVFELLDRADNGLYKAKDMGRNRVCCYKDPANSALTSAPSSGQDE